MSLFFILHGWIPSGQTNIYIYIKYKYTNTHIYMDKIYVLSRKYAAMQSDKETFIEEDTRYKNHST